MEGLDRRARDASKICVQETRERDGRSKRYASKRYGMLDSCSVRGGVRARDARMRCEQEICVMRFEAWEKSKRYKQNMQAGDGRKR